MPDTTLPLNDLTQQIAQYQSELERLRQEYEARQARLTELAQKREQLQAQLRQVEADMRAVTQGTVPAAAATARAPSPKPSVKKTSGPTLIEALMEVAREANRPMTAREFGKELKRRKYPTTSSNITNLVQTRLTNLVKQGVFRRAEGRPGVVLSATTNGSPSPAPTKKTAKRGRRKGQPTLASLLTKLLQKSRKPVAAHDLAEQVLATGYQTSSKNFIDVVWTALGQLKVAENVKGQGWRLKKGSA